MYKQHAAKAGFGEGTPQQVRPGSAPQFQILKLWPQVDTCLSLFQDIFRFEFSKCVRLFKSWGANQKKSCSADMCRRTRHRQGNSAAESVRAQRVRGSVAEFCPQGDIRGKEFLSRVCGQKWVPPKACHRHANRSVSYLRGSPLAPNLRSCPCVAAALSGLPAFCAGSWRGIQIQTAHLVFKVRVSRIAGRSPGCKFSRENKESRPAGDQRILSEVYGGKMVRCDCGAAV